MKYCALVDFLDKYNIKYKTNEKTALLVSIRVGGIAPIVVYPDTIEQLCVLLKYISGKYRYYLLGNWTNTYFCDFYDGVVISTKNLNRIFSRSNEIEAECGASLTGCAVYAYKNKLSGLEFAYGIPGFVGGSLYMNASAYDSSISNILKECLVYDIDSESTCVLQNKDLMFKEKHSIFMEKRLAILKASFSLNIDNKDKIKAKMDEYQQRRSNSQPLDIPSAGSAFKRPKYNYASKLIDEAGLKGYSIGDAQISTKHAGFIVNKGSASSSDIRELIRFIKLEIKNKFNIDLEEEIIYVE